MAEFQCWITDGTTAPFYARREFRTTKEIMRSEARVCGLGQFLFYVNGKKVGDHELDPGWTNYRKLIQYVTFDVTEYLQPGKNALGVEVGNGWFLKTDEHYTFRFPEFMPPNPNPYRPFGKCLVLALELEIFYEDGSVERICADESFRVKKHPVVMSNVYGSETIDGRLRQKGWNRPGFDDSGWRKALVVPEDEAPKGRLMEQFQPPVKVIHTYEGKLVGRITAGAVRPAAGNISASAVQTAVGSDPSAAKQGAAADARARAEQSAGKGVRVRSKLGVAENPPGRIREIYDFRQNLSGILEVELKGRRGDQVKLYPAEKLAENGDVDQMAKGWVNVDSCETFILGEDDVWERFRMKFTYLAGRYVAVERLPGDASQPNHQIGLRNLCAHAISSAWKTDGSFTCDDKRCEQIYSLVEKAVEANMLSVHTDCPTIERFAWQEPNHLMAPAIFYMKDGKSLWEKFLLDMRTDQHTAEDWFYDMEGKPFRPGAGLMPSQCPCYVPNVLPVPGMGSFYDIIAWGSTCILGPWHHYRFYGDIRIIEENYEAGMRYLEHLKTKMTVDGFICHGLGDWGNPEKNYLRENIETAFLYADAVALEKFARLLGKKRDADKLAVFAEAVKDNYNEKLLVQDPVNRRWCYRAWDHPGEIFITQASQALPLYWGMVPGDKEADVVQSFRMALEEKQAFLAGEVGLPYVIQTARGYGMNDLIARFILRDEHPSYYAFVLDGETTLGEYWETNPRSHCHDMMGHIIEWYYNGIAGILPEAPGFRKICIRPYLPETMTEFTCKYRSAAGLIQVHVKELPDAVLLEAGLPEQVEYRIETGELERRGKPVRVDVRLAGQPCEQ